ncbi:MAG: rhodanese-like domain-containing protein [Thiomicrorhabdus sp.]|jgi:rhodanese-related sulfurtransferase|nr:rhodanese-like domain-containing protein [Thiomicrorhabdus sp.]
MFSEFVQEQTLLFIALVVVVAMLAYSYLGDKLSGYKSVNTDEATRLFNDDAFLLDVRTATEFKEGSIGEATNVPVTDLSANMNKLPKDKEKPLLIYCLTGARSGRAAGTLTKAGYTQVFNLAGGINAWKSAGLPVAKAKAKRNRKK